MHNATNSVGKTLKIRSVRKANTGEGKKLSSGCADASSGNPDKPPC